MQPNAEENFGIFKWFDMFVMDGNCKVFNWKDLKQILDWSYFASKINKFNKQLSFTIVGKVGKHHFSENVLENWLVIWTSFFLPIATGHYTAQVGEAPKYL